MDEKIRLIKREGEPPIYLVHEGDDRASVYKVIARLTELNEVNLISGTMSVDTNTGEFTAYNLAWEIVDLTTTQAEP